MSAEDHAKAIRERVTASIRAAIDNYAALPHRTEEEAMATLAVCMSACPVGKYDAGLGVCTARGAGCQTYHQWIRTLVVTGCDLAATPPLPPTPADA